MSVKEAMEMGIKRIQQLEAENKRLREATSTCVGIIRASAQVNTKRLADMLEQALSRESKK